MSSDPLRQQADQYLRTSLQVPNAHFRDGQWESIASLVRDRATLLVVQRTGWGKSMVYFLATRLLRDQGAGPTLLISPLLALMRNQIEAARRIGITAETINSTNVEEWSAIERRLLNDEIDILLISPERLANDRFRDNVLQHIAGRVGLLAVDEAHCISDWGHDFRPDYRRIVRILQAMPPNVPVLATTATANDRVVDDITKQIGDRLQVIRGPLGRATLRLQNISLPSQAARLAWLAAIVPRLTGSGIIYTLTVRDAQTVAAWLESRGIDAPAYYADLDNEERERLEDALLANEVKALVATTALGMGYDKPDIGFVIHFQRPGSVIAYYQQVGRAGRSAEDAYGVMLSGLEDSDISDYFIRSAFPPEKDIRAVLTALEESEGLKTAELEERLNIRRSDITKILKILSVHSPAAITLESGRWVRTPNPYRPDLERIRHVTALRRAEQAQMAEYLQSDSCLMAFLRSALDDPSSEPCGRCAACLGQPLLPPDPPEPLVREAIAFLRRLDRPIPPRRRWPSQALALYGDSMNIPADARAEDGRALCVWGDSGWGALVRRGKYQDGYFADELVEASKNLILRRWRPSPTPTWLTCVPSLRNRLLVPSFAERLAAALGIPYVACITKVRNTQPQKQMNNSCQQVENLRGAFRIDRRVASGPVLLVDDIVDSRWTLTVLAAQLRDAGSGPVFPFALAEAAPRE